MSQTLYTIGALVAQSANIESKRGSKTHSMPSALMKDFGTIYYNNKVVIYDEETGIIEIRMMIGTATETQYNDYHAVRIAIYGAKGKVYNSYAELLEEEAENTKSGKKATYDPQKTLQRIQDASKAQLTTDTNGDISDSKEETFSIKYGRGGAIELSGVIIPVANTESSHYGQSYGSTGKIFYLKEPISTNSLVRVNCSCSDYHYTCAWYNYEQGVHLGPRPHGYSGRTGRRLDPVRNIHKTAGICKHLMIMLMLLMSGGIIDTKGTSNMQANRELLNSRPEKLNVPQKLTDGNKLSLMYKALEKDIRKAEKTRVFDIGYTGYDHQSEVLRGYDDWQRGKVKQNAKDLRSGKRTDAIRKGVSHAGYRNEWTKQAGKDIKKAIKNNTKSYTDVLNKYKAQYRGRVEDLRKDISGLKDLAWKQVYGTDRPDKRNEL
jgi:hypothetical protein